MVFLIFISCKAKLKDTGKFVMEAEKNPGNFDFLNLEYDYSRDFTFFLCPHANSKLFFTPIGRACTDVTLTGFTAI